MGGVPEDTTNGRDAIQVKTRGRDDLASAATELLKDRQHHDRLVSYAHEIVSRKSPEAYFQSVASVFSQACANRD